jgi:hypothetical protein
LFPHFSRNLSKNFDVKKLVRKVFARNGGFHKIDTWICRICSGPGIGLPSGPSGRSDFSSPPAGPVPFGLSAMVCPEEKKTHFLHVGMYDPAGKRTSVQFSTTWVNLDPRDELGPQG